MRKSDIHNFIKKEYSYTDTIQQQESFSIESNIHKEKIQLKNEKGDTSSTQQYMKIMKKKSLLKKMTMTMN